MLSTFTSRKTQRSRAQETPRTIRPITEPQPCLAAVCVLGVADGALQNVVGRTRFPSWGEWSCPEVSFGNVFGDDNGHAGGGARQLP
jgi:hypothetical protein